MHPQSFLGKKTINVGPEAIRREILRVLCGFSSMLFTVTSTALPLDIYISSDSCNLLKFLQFSYRTL